ncbi:MAG: peroxiredoxin-like family protein [Alphaproteobacteria bacterium]
MSIKKLLAVLVLIGLMGGAAAYLMNVKKAKTFEKALNEMPADANIAVSGEAPPIDSGHESDIVIGSTAPDFTLPNADGEGRTLSEMLQNGPVILSFYRGGWCPYCNDQIYAYQQILPEFEELGAQLVAISPEKPESVQDTMSKNYVTFEVLSDEGNKIARNYDLLWTVPEDKREGFSTWLKGETGQTLAEFNGVDNFELPIPATFVIAQDGTVVYVFKEEDYKLRAKNEDIIKALENLADHPLEEE